MMKNLYATLVMLMTVVISFAQDTIHKTNGEDILCKVSEIGSSEIKYYKWDNLEGPIYAIRKSEVSRITFQNGTIEEMKSAELSVIPAQRRTFKRAITTHPFSIISGHLNFGYQQAMTRSTSLIGEIGIIGPKIGDGLIGNYSSKGAYLKVGYRLKRTPEFVTDDMEWGHNLGGMYIQPTLAFSIHDDTYPQYVYNDMNDYVMIDTKDRVTSGAFLINVGRQMIAGDIMTFDISAGLGFGVTSSSDSYRSLYHYSHFAGTNIPLAYDFSFTMGFLLK